MTVYFGWIDVLCHYKIDIDEEDSEWMKALKKIKRRIKEIDMEKSISVRVVNGATLVRCDGCLNRWLPELDEVIELFEFIGNIAPGSYGLLYIRNDEDPILHDRFQVIRLAKGKIDRFDDSLLSPVNPTIEE